MQEMEPSSSSVSTGTLSQAACKILAVLRAQSPHAGRRNQVYTDRRRQSQGGCSVFENASSAALLTF